MPEAADAQLLLDLQSVTVGDYEILGILGRGGMGMVYLAHDISLSKKVAIKVLPPSMLLGDASVERFRREARIAASLRHRHITSVFALKETTKLLFFVMEYVEGRTLDAVLRDEGQLPIAAAGAVIHDAFSALTYAHRREVIHRDLKPGNIIVDIEGLAMITDFGVAKVNTVQGLTTTGSTVGSPKYMGPEQWSGKATHYTDQYALGCVAYQLLTGRAPFEGDTLEELMKQQLFDPPQPLLELRPDCPQPLADTVTRMLEKAPDKRWPSLEAARAAMGLQPPSPDDDARTQLADWAKRGHDLRALPKTPRSPIPISRANQPRAPAAVAEAPTAPLMPSAPSHVAHHSSKKTWLIGLASAAAAGVITWAVVRGLSGGGEGGGGGGGQQSGAVAGIAIEGAPSSITVGERVPLNARARDAAGNVMPAVAVTWSTSDSGVAVVSADGALQARAPGTVRLRASGGGRDATIAVTVQRAAVASVIVLPREARLSPGATARLNVSVRGRDGNELSGRSVEWTSNAPAVASVSQEGVVSAQAPGTATVAASSEGVSGAATITVGRRPPAVLVALDVVPNRVSLQVGQSLSLLATARGRSINRAEWVSSDATVATVSSSGVVTGVRAGTVAITAASDGYATGSTTVTVAPAPPPAASAMLQMIVRPWANVTIDGVAKGQRTRALDTLAAGIAHRIRLEHPSSQTIDTVITLRPGERRQLTFEMKPRSP